MKKTGISNKNVCYDLSCMGILVLDVFGTNIETFPQKGTSEYFDRLEIHPGGCAYNTGVDACRLGLRVSMMGKVGCDSFGEIMLNSMCKEGADTKAVVQSRDTNTAFSFVMVPGDGQRRIYHTFGVNRILNPEDVDRQRILASSMLHVAGAGLMPAIDGESTAELFKFARQHGILTSMDPVVKEDVKGSVLPCLPHLDIFLPNMDESYYITGYKNPVDQLKYYIDAGVKIAGIKLGPKGCLISDGIELLTLGVYPVPVVDTCGAGDAFIAGFLYGILQEWEVEMTAKFATAAASFCVQSIGATTAIPKAQEILNYMKNNELEECHICQL